MRQFMTEGMKFSPKLAGKCGHKKTAMSVLPSDGAREVDQKKYTFALTTSPGFMMSLNQKQLGYSPDLPP